MTCFLNWLRNIPIDLYNWIFVYEPMEYYQDRPIPEVYDLVDLAPPDEERLP